MKTKIISGVVIVVAVSGLSFYGGMKYQSTKGVASIGQFAGMRNGQLQGARGGAGGGFISGEVLSKDDKSVTVKTQNGGSSIAFYSPTTAIEKAASGSWADIIVGKTITIRGTQNSDGTYTAQTIQLTPPQIRLMGSLAPSPRQ